MTCTTAGPLSRLTWRSVRSTSSTSWPLIGPEYLIPRYSKKVRGATSSLRPSFIRRPASIALSPAGRARNPRSSQQLVDIGLVTGVPEDPVVGAAKDAVQGQRQLDHAEIGPQMTSGLGNRRHQELPDLFGERTQLRLAERADVRRTRDPVEYRCTGNLVHIPLFESSEEPAVPPLDATGEAAD